MSQDLLRVPRSADPVPTTPVLRSRRVPVWTFALTVVLVVGGLLAVASSLGWFQTTGRGASLVARPAAADGAAPAPAATTAPSPDPGSTTEPGSPSTAPTPTGTGAGTPRGTGTPGEDGEGKAAPTAGSSPDDVKGWMSVQQVLDAFPVSQQALYERFGIAAGTDTGTAFKELAESQGFEMSELRDWLAEQGS